MDAVVVAVIVAVALPAALYLSARERRRRYALMIEVAHHRRGHADSGGLFGNPSAEIASDGVVIRVHTTTKHDGYTEWTAQVPHPGTVAFRVRPALGASSARDVVVGTHDGFDDRFVVETPDPGAVRRVWTESNAKVMTIWFGTSTLRSSGHELALTRPRVAVEPRDIERGIDLLLDIARTDTWGIQALRSLDDATFHDDGSPFPYATIAGPGQIRIGPELLGQRAATRARAQGHTASGTAVVDIVDGLPTDAGEPTPLPPYVAHYAHALGTAHIGWSEREISITWPGIETDPRRLQSAISLLRELARAPAMGVFR
jgi:hypothetical protein